MLHLLHWKSLHFVHNDWMLQDIIAGLCRRNKSNYHFRYWKWEEDLEKMRRGGWGAEELRRGRSWEVSGVSRRESRTPARRGGRAAIFWEKQEGKSEYFCQEGIPNVRVHYINIFRDNNNLDMWQAHWPQLMHEVNWIRTRFNEGEECDSNESNQWWRVGLAWDQNLGEACDLRKKWWGGGAPKNLRRRKMGLRSKEALE